MRALPFERHARDCHSGETRSLLGRGEGTRQGQGWAGTVVLLGLTVLLTW
jgi:hypothetical protein